MPIRRLRTTFAIGLLGVFSASISCAQEAEKQPLSAINWLSDSILLDDTVGERPADETPSDDVSKSAVPATVTTLSLDGRLPDAIGLISAEAAGLPRDLWGASPAADIANRLTAEPLDMLPAMQELLRQILLAELEPPIDANTDKSLFLARVDRLLQLGLLAEARMLLDAAPDNDAALFRRSFDVALLTGSETAACEIMTATPQFSPTYPARIFCLARMGDWQAAAVTLESANAIGILTPEQDHLMARFLDPEIFEGVAPPPSPFRPTPLDYRLFEAIGEPKATTSLPIAFAHADMRPSSGWKARLHAAERLAETGAISARTLFDLYLQNRPSASGGVWERARAIHALEKALAENDTDELAEVIPVAWSEMAAARLEHPFAHTYGADIYRASFALPQEVRSLAFRIGLVSPEFMVIAQAHRPVSADERFLVSVARGLPAIAPSNDRLAQAVQRAFVAQSLAHDYADLLEHDRKGEALLKAIGQFSAGAYGDYDKVTDAIFLFRMMGLDLKARAAALELLILERRG